MLKMVFMRSVAKWFILGKSTAAYGDQFPTSQIIKSAGFIHYFEISLYSQRTVIIYRDFCAGHRGAGLKMKLGICTHLYGAALSLRKNNSGKNIFIEYT
jgi:hypothetical protein